MIYFKFQGVRVAGLAVAVPEKEVLVDSFNTKFGADQVQKFKKMTGVEKFRVADSKQTASDLCFIAARELLKNKDIPKETLGALIFVSQTPDYKTPATACVIHNRLGLSKDCLVYDINLGCSGYVYGLQTLFSIMQTSNVERSLLVVGDTLNKMVSSEDRSAAMLFGDAGSATLLERDENAPPVSFSCRTDGSGYRAIIAQGGGFRNQFATSEASEWADGNMRSDCDLFMNGTEVFNFTITEVPALLNEFMAKENTSSCDYEHLVMHQANLFILKQIAKRTKFPIDKVPISIDEFGNTSSASIPVTLAKIYGSSTADDFQKLLLCAFGVGLSWATTSISLQPKDILPIISTSEHYMEGGVIRG